MWIVRLIGLLPDLSQCTACGAGLNGSRAYFHALADGLLCAKDKRLASSEISADSRSLAAEMFRAPLERFVAVPWPRQRGADLRKFLAQRIERHIEKKLVTAVMLSAPSPVSAHASPATGNWQLTTSSAKQKKSGVVEREFGASFCCANCHLLNCHSPGPNEW